MTVELIGAQPQGFWGPREGGHGQGRAAEEGVKEDEAGELCWSSLGCGKELPCHVGKRLQNLPMESQELLLGSGGGGNSRQRRLTLPELGHQQEEPSCPCQVGDTPAVEAHGHPA